MDLRNDQNGFNEFTLFFYNSHANGAYLSEERKADLEEYYSSPGEEIKIQVKKNIPVRDVYWENIPIQVSQSVAYATLTYFHPSEKVHKHLPHRRSFLRKGEVYVNGVDIYPETMNITIKNVDRKVDQHEKFQRLYASVAKKFGKEVANAASKKRGKAIAFLNELVGIETDCSVQEVLAAVKAVNHAYSVKPLLLLMAERPSKATCRWVANYAEAHSFVERHVPCLYKGMRINLDNKVEALIRKHGLILFLTRSKEIGQ